MLASLNSKQLFLNQNKLVMNYDAWFSDYYYPVGSIVGGVIGSIVFVVVIIVVIIFLVKAKNGWRPTNSAGEY